MAPAQPVRFVTIGAYGFRASTFFAALQRAGVDTFCDIRYRRGVRGAEYAFVNSSRLQSHLAHLGIRYLHFRDLAPSPDLRHRQDAADKTQCTTKRKRVRLSAPFIAGYLAQCLSTFNTQHFLLRLGPQARVVALFCVERYPAACHRSLLADRLQRDNGADIVHLLPD